MSYEAEPQKWIFYYLQCTHLHHQANNTKSSLTKTQKPFHNFHLILPISFLFLTSSFEFQIKTILIHCLLPLNINPPHHQPSLDKHVPFPLKAITHPLIITFLINKTPLALADVVVSAMDITNNSTTSIKTPEAESETPTRIQPPKPIHTNGLLKRHHPISTPSLQPPPPPQPLSASTYRDCLKNHAAHLGGHALDGCGEFMPCPPSNPNDPTSLRCAACGCHRNFHRREVELNHLRNLAEFQSQNRHQPPPPPQPPLPESPNSPSPPPISSSYYPASAPHMLLALSSAPQPVGHHTPAPVPHSSSRKRFRTKFTQQQKEKMLEFAGKVGWKIQRRDEAAIQEFCNEIRVDRGVLKVWMHNNKSTLGRNENHGNKRINNGNGNDNSSSGSEEKNRDGNAGAGAAAAAANGNGSSTSS